MRILTTLLIASFPGSIFADWETNMPRGVTPTSEIAYDIHMLIFYITVVIGILVFGAMLYSIIYHRKSVGHKPASFHESTKVEIIWTVIPFIIFLSFLFNFSFLSVAIAVVIFSIWKFPKTLG